MFSEAALHSTAATASQIASSNDSGGGSSLIIIVLLAIAAVWLLSALRGSEPTVVVVQKSPGAVLGWGVIALAVVIIYFVYLGPGSGSI
jgi:amino acid transporter